MKTKMKCNRIGHSIGVYTVCINKKSLQASFGNFNSLPLRMYNGPFQLVVSNQ